VVVTLALILVDRYQERGALPTPGTERTAPTDHIKSLEAFV